MRRIIYTLLFAFAFTLVFAGNFTPGNIVVVRVGDGSAALTNAANAVFLDEYTVTGTLVQSVALPTSGSGGNHALTLSGTATSEGALTLSSNGQYLVLGGYDAAPGYASVASDTSARTIARIGSNGTVNTTTGFATGGAYKKNNFRGAVTSDGTGFWCSGTGSSSTGGTWYIPFGSFTSSATQIATDLTNSRTVNIFGGQLYVSASSSTFHGVSSVGTGLPTASGQTTTNLPGMPASDTSSSSYSFYFFDMSNSVPGVDVVYVCDDHTGANGGVLKYSLVSGAWVSNGNVSSAAGLRGITGFSTCGSVNLFVSGNSGVSFFRDTTGYNKTISGTFTPIISAATNTAIRGIAFTPGSTAPTGVQASIGSSTDVTCNGAANGIINVAATGGTSPYTYNWGNNVTSQNRNNLAPGTYTVTVTDAAGCSSTASATISQPAVLSASASKTDVLCNGNNNGSVSLTVNGGTTSYSYLWSNGATTQNLSSITANTYNVTVTDNHLCTATASATVNQPSAIVINPSVTNLPCTGGSNSGAVNITVSGGNPGYTYSWSNSATTQNLTSLNAGAFIVTVTDNTNCTATASAIVSQSGSMTITPNVTNVTCNGLSNGSINVTVSGGTPAYSYAWSNSGTAQNQTGLAAGSYILTVTDNGGCTLINSISVTEPAALLVSATPTALSCHGDSTGTVTLSSTGGTGSYSYAWSNAATSQNLSNVPANTYSATVTDNNGCSTTVSATVTQPTAIAVSGQITNASSFAAADGAVVLTVSGGTGSYSYTWTNSNTTGNNTGLVAGQYCVTVSDANLCKVSDCYTVDQPSGIVETGLLQDFNVCVAGGELLVNARLNSEVESYIEVVSITGQLIITTERVTVGEWHLLVPSVKLASGCYVVKIVTGQGIACKKVVIAR